MDNVINNPYIPCVEPLPQPLQSGYVIRVRGTSKPSATCFSINLQSGTIPRNDIALHLSPVFSPPPRLVRNSMQNGQWGPEESHGPYFPFVAGQGFEIMIVADPDKFKIGVNGQHYTEFDHRLPMHMVSHISIDGDVIVNTIKFEPTSYESKSFGGQSEISRPLGFLAPGMDGGGVAGQGYNNPTSGCGAPSLPYPSTTSFPSANLYPMSPTTSGRTSPSNPYGPMPASNPYAPPSPSHPYAPLSPSHPYAPPSPSNPYGPPPGSPYGPSGGGYPAPPPPSPTSYPAQGGYSGPYPSQPGPYPGTTVIYPGQEGQKSSGSSGLNAALAAGAAAVAGAAGAAVMGGKHKGGKHGHSLNPASALLGGIGRGGPAGMLSGGVGSLLGGGGKHGQKQSGSGPMGIPMGGALAGGAAALAGAYMLSKSPIGKVLKPKKMKKLYKHKHKLKHGFHGFGSSSSSSSSSEEE